MATVSGVPVRGSSLKTQGFFDRLSLTHATRVLFLVVALAACGQSSPESASVPRTPSPSPTETSYEIRGALILSNPNEAWPDDQACAEGFGAFYDIFDGTEIRIFNENGAMIAMSLLTGARGVGPKPPYSGCHYEFETRVPRAEFYSFRVGNRRDSATTTFGELVSTLDFYVVLRISV